MMLIPVLILSSFAAGFIIGAVVVDTMYARMLRAAAVQPVHEHRNPIDLFPSEFSHDWSRVE